MKPTCEQLFDEEFPLVYSHIGDNWRHGVTRVEVYHIGDEYWKATYRRSTDGEYNGLRDGDAQIVQVYPKEVVTTIYESKI